MGTGSDGAGQSAHITCIIEAVKTGRRAGSPRCSRMCWQEVRDGWRNRMVETSTEDPYNTMKWFSKCGRATSNITYKHNRQGRLRFGGIARTSSAQTDCSSEISKEKFCSPCDNVPPPCEI